MRAEAGVPLTKMRQYDFPPSPQTTPRPEMAQLAVHTSPSHLTHRAGYPQVSPGLMVIRWLLHHPH